MGSMAVVHSDSRAGGSTSLGSRSRTLGQPLGKSFPLGVKLTLRDGDGDSKARYSSRVRRANGTGTVVSRCVALGWSVRHEELSSKQPSYSLVFGVVFRVPWSPHRPQPSSAIYAVYYHVQLMWCAARTQGSVHTGQALCQLGCIPSPLRSRSLGPSSRQTLPI